MLLRSLPGFSFLEEKSDYSDEEGEQALLQILKKVKFRFFGGIRLKIGSFELGFLDYSGNVRFMLLIPILFI